MFIVDIMETVSKCFFWFANNPSEGIIILIILYWMIKRIKNNKREALVQAAIYLVAQAEKQWDSKEGKIKFADVYSALQRKYPIVTFLFSKETIEGIINEALESFYKTLKKKDDIVAMDNMRIQQDTLLQQQLEIKRLQDKLAKQQSEQKTHLENISEEHQALTQQINAMIQ